MHRRARHRDIAFDEQSPVGLDCPTSTLSERQPAPGRSIAIDWLGSMPALASRPCCRLSLRRGVCFSKMNLAGRLESTRHRSSCTVGRSAVLESRHRERTLPFNMAREIGTANQKILHPDSGSRLPSFPYPPQNGRRQSPFLQNCKSTRGNLASTRPFSAASWNGLGLGGDNRGVLAVETRELDWVRHI